MPHSAESPALVTKIPPELIDLIFDNLRDDKKAVKASSLVCRSWADSARPVLFNTLVWSIKVGKQPRFQDLYSLFLCERVCGLVLELELRGGDGDKRPLEWTYVDAVIDAVLLMGIVNSLPYLRFLKIHHCDLSIRSDSQVLEPGFERRSLHRLVLSDLIADAVDITFLFSLFVSIERVELQNSPRQWYPIRSRPADGACFFKFRPLSRTVPCATVTNLSIAPYVKELNCWLTRMDGLQNGLSSLELCIASDERMPPAASTGAAIDALLHYFTPSRLTHFALDISNLHLRDERDTAHAWSHIDLRRCPSLESLSITLNAQTDLNLGIRPGDIMDPYANITNFWTIISGILARSPKSLSHIDMSFRTYDDIAHPPVEPRCWEEFRSAIAHLDQLQSFTFRASLFLDSLLWSGQIRTCPIPDIWRTELTKNLRQQAHILSFP